MLLEKTTQGARQKGIRKEQEIKILQRMVKQPKEAAKQFELQNRGELAKKELAQTDIISSFYPNCYR